MLKLHFTFAKSIGSCHWLHLHGKRLSAEGRLARWSLFSPGYFGNIPSCGLQPPFEECKERKAKRKAL